MPLTVLMSRRKQFAFRRRREAIQDVGVVTNGQVGEQLHFISRRGQFVERGKGNEDFVPTPWIPP